AIIPAARTRIDMPGGSTFKTVGSIGRTLPDVEVTTTYGKPALKVRERCSCASRPTSPPAPRRPRQFFIASGRRHLRGALQSVHRRYVGQSMSPLRRSMEWAEGKLK